MNVDKFKHHHLEILECFHTLRQHVRPGVVENVQKITRTDVSMIVTP